MAEENTEEVMVPASSIPRTYNPFANQGSFMQSCGQTVAEYNEEQLDLYISLIDEEVAELKAARTANDKVEMLDALIDILVVTIGAGHSMGANMEGAWEEVHSTNMAKIDPETGMVIKNEEGKVLKPEGWVAPVLSSYLEKEQP